jgi:ABC-2 type transport system ATP-binding protein
MEKERKEIFWSRFAEDLDQRTNHVVGKENFDKMKAYIAEQKNLGNTLELGCGTGAYTRILIDNAKHLTVTDYSDEMIKYCEQFFKGNDKLLVEKANCINLHYKNQTFDTVFMGNLLHVIDGPLEAVMEAKRVLRRGGRLIIISFTNEGMKLRHILPLMFRFLKTFGKPKHGEQLTIKKATEIVNNAGFIVEKTKLIGGSTKAIFISAITN